MPKKPQYKVIDIGNPSEPKQARYKKILDQIPEGKTMEITESTFKQPSNKALVRIIDPKDIPTLPKAKCLRCGYTWTLRTEHPKECPKCHSPYWNKPRRSEMKK
jgi:rubrerythrin